MEKHIQSIVCRYISTYHRDIVFTSDQSGLRVMGHGQQQQLKYSKSCRGIPDLIIMHPAGGCHGLMIELKNDNVTIYRRDGELVADKHIREQYELLTHLRSIGYAAFFCMGVDGACGCIEKYVHGFITPDSFKRTPPVSMVYTANGCDGLIFEKNGLI
jgi:hypothetical protein